MPHIDIAAVENAVAEVGVAEIMSRFGQLGADDIEIKSDNSPATVADGAAERALKRQLTDILPGSVAVGEEAFAADHAILSLLERPEEYVWIIDPIDGTSNFIKGIAQFATMVALVHRGQTVIGVIHDPSTGQTLTAEQGSGVRLNGHKMRLAGADPAAPRTAIIGARIKKLLTRPDIAPLLGPLPTLITGSSAAFDYGRLFTGDALFANDPAVRVAFLLYLHSKPWDHVPGLLMLAEAGGYAADLCGKAYNVRDISNHGLLLAPDRPAWEGVHQALKPAIEALFKP